MKAENIDITPDHTTKFFFSDQSRSCALANTYLSDDIHHIVKCERICSEETSVCIVDNKIISKGSYRDLLFEAWDEDGYSFYIAFEFQTEEDDHMPYRNGEYDYFRYRNQYIVFVRAKITEFRPKIVITITIYLGAKDWTKAIYLSEMVEGPSWLLEKGYFNDYCANVEHIKDAPLEKCSDPEVYGLLNAFQKYYMSHEKPEALKETNLGQEAAILFAVYTNNVELLKDALKLTEGETINMCTFTEQWNRHAEERGEARGIEMGKSQGIEIGKSEGIEIGKSEGIEIGKIEMIRNLMSINHFNANVAMKMLGIPEEKQQTYLPYII